MHKRYVTKTLTVSYREGITPSGHIFENHCHPSFELIAVFSGSVSIVLDNFKYNLCSGEAAIVPPLCYHSLYCDSDTEYERMTVLFDNSFIPEGIYDELCAKLSDRPIISVSELSVISDLLRELLQGECEERLLPLVSSYITNVLYMHAMSPEGKCPTVTADPTVKRIIEYIDSHIGEKILLDDIAAHIFVSKSTVSHLFAEHMKISVKQYVLQKKLSYAATKISEGTPAGEAARLIGYDNYANFYKVYKKVFGISPKKKSAENAN
jgi:AraC-like DNA-binding protein